MKGEVTSVLKPLLLGRCIQLIVQYAWFLGGLEAHGHGLFIIANGNTSSLVVALSTWIVRLRFLLLPGIVNNTLIASDVEESVRRK